MTIQQHIENLVNYSSTSMEIEEVLEDSISLMTRENGDVGEEEYGEEDYADAKNVKAQILEEFPNAKCRIDTCDEWVTLEIEF